MEIQLTEILEAQKKALGEWEAFKLEVSKSAATSDSRLQTAEATIKGIEQSVKSLEANLKARSAGSLPGVEDEISKNGPVAITDVLFNPGSRSRSIVKEYTQKRRDALAALGVSGGPEQRDMTAGSDSGGGYLISTQLLPGFIEKARERAVVWQNSGLTVYSGLTGTPVELPKENGVPSVSWVGENSAPTASDSTVDQIRFTPKKIAGLVKISNRLIRYGTIAEQVVMRALTRSLGLEIDRVLLRGSGSSYEPRGIANTSGLNEVEIGNDGGAFTFDVAQDMVAELEDDNTAFGALKFIGHPHAFHSMKTERIAQFSGQTAGAYLMLPMSDANLRDMLGYEFIKTTTIPKTLTKGSGTNLTEVYFGNWEDLLLAMWQDIEFKASDVTGDSSGSALTTDKLWIVAQAELDVQVARSNSFCLVNDATTV